MHERTNCVDCRGHEIFVGDSVFVNLNGQNPNLSGIPGNDSPFIGTVESRKDAIDGFRVQFGKGYLVWDADGEPCPEVHRIAC